MLSLIQNIRFCEEPPTRRGSATAVGEIFANRQKAIRRGLCFNRSIQPPVKQAVLLIRKILATALRIHPPAKQGVSKSPAGLFELCCNSSIQSATAVGEIFANRQKAIRRSMPTGVELCCNSSIQSCAVAIISLSRFSLIACLIEFAS